MTHDFVGDPIDGKGTCKECGLSPWSYNHNVAGSCAFEASIDNFCSRLKDKLLQSAKAKGYHGDETDGRKMYDSIINLAGEGHAMGEIIYKLTRYRRLKDPIDIEKAAAWCFLIWDAARREQSK